MAAEKTLIYIADPMCSWCWGFSPVIEQVREMYRDTADMDLVMGGLRAGNTEVMDEDMRQYILGHWRHVHDASNQPFDFSFAMPEGFIYDTEPSCRAVVAMRELDPEKQFTFLKALEHAFYANNTDITDSGELVTIAGGLEIDTEEFEQLLNSDEIRQKTREEFQLTASLGVRGFPTLLGKSESGYVLFCSGYTPFEKLGPVVGEWIGGSP